jgi:3-oxoacyl-(acyl-carrier-protein) synthase
MEIKMPSDPPFRKMRKYMSQQSLLAAMAAREAWGEAQALERGFEPDKIGLYAGVGLTAVDLLAGREILMASLDETGSFAPENFSQVGQSSLNPLWAFETLANMPACIISVLEGLKGESAVYCPFEDGAAQALWEAAAALEQGFIDLAVVVAADTPHKASSLTDLAKLRHILPNQTASPAAGAVVLARAGEGGHKTGAILKNFQIQRVASPPDDPLSDLLGRTMAAAPILLAVLAVKARQLNLKTSIICSEGHRFSFEAAI